MSFLFTPDSIRDHLSGVMSGLMIIFLSSIEFLFERTAITSIARFNLSKSGRGRVRSFLNLPSLKLSLTEFAWISLLSLDKIETELSISCLTLYL